MLQKVAMTGVDLDSVYSRTLQRIREQEGDQSRLGVEALMWVSHSERPLRIDELCCALAVGIEATDLDHKNIQPQDKVLGACLGLAIVDTETSTVRLTHYTLQEYLSRPGIMPGTHKTLGQTCLAYLNYDQVKGLPANNLSKLADMPFLEYSSLHWGDHAKMELSDHGRSLALELLDQYNNHISSTLLFNQICRHHFHQLTHHLFTGLHCASYFGIDGAVAALIETKGCDVNQRDGYGFTPLIWAARQGNQGVVRLLLAHDDADPDRADNDSRTPLWWASWSGHEAVVRLLLSCNEANPNEANPNEPDNTGRGERPVWWTFRKGHRRVKVVRCQLSRDKVNPDKPDDYGQTPFGCASESGREGVLKLLLACGDVNPDKPDNYGRTPLWWASWNGHEEVARLLLARGDVNPDAPNKDGQTPLCCACEDGHEGVVRLLLTHSNVNPNSTDNNRRTPLVIATLNGHEEVVRLLLARNDTNPDIPDIYGKTPLGIASLHGYMEIAALLQLRTTVPPIL